MISSTQQEPTFGDHGRPCRRLGDRTAAFKRPLPRVTDPFRANAAAASGRGRSSGAAAGSAPQCCPTAPRWAILVTLQASRARLGGRARSTRAGDVAAHAAPTGSPGHGQEQCRLCGTLGRVAGHAQRLEVSERLGKSRTAATGRGQLVNATAAAIWRRLPSGCEVSTRLTRVPLVAVDYSTSTLKRQQEPCGGT